MGRTGNHSMRRLALLLIFILSVTCAAPRPEQLPSEISIPPEEKEPVPEFSKPQQPEPVPAEPEFIPVRNGSSPLKAKTVSISARKTPLRDVLYTIAEAASLNLVMERGVNPEQPMTMTLADLTVEEALAIVCDSADYFYSVRDNILIIKATETMVFELGQPNVIQDYRIDVGGDILAGTTSGGETSTSISGDVSMKHATDPSSYEFWNALEKTLTTLIAPEDPGQSDTSSRFVINRMTGTIMVTASKRTLEKISTYITNLKLALNRQVLIEARIIEVQLTEGLKFGIDWTAVGRVLTEDLFRVSTNNFTGLFSPGTQNFSINILDIDDFTLLLQALEQQGDVKTLSNPRVNIMNGQTSLLSVGRNTTFVSKVETTTTVSDSSGPITTFTVETNSILSGIMFGLVPYISSSGEVTMTITPIITNLLDLEARTIGTGDDQIEINLPVVDLREMSTTVKVVDGQLIIIGGLIDKKEVLREARVPFISDIPFLGTAFKSIEKEYENKELVVMLIPRVIN